MLNSGFRGKRATDGTGAISAQTQSVQATNPVPKITGYAVTDNNYVASDDTAATSGSIIVVYGNNFVTGMTVYINNSLVASTYLDSTRITFTMPALSNGTYIIYMTTPQGGAAILSPGIVYSGFPTWTTSNYNASTTTINIQLLASGDAPLTFALQGGSTLPAGISLTSTGVLTGTTSVTADAAYNFTVIVTDTQLQNVQQLITLSFVFGDSYWKYTTLLLNGETTVTPFISDASANSFGLTIVGDTKPVLFNPYQGNGYYSAYLPTTADFISYADTTAGNFGTGDFTVELWVYMTGNTGAAGHNLIMASVASSTWEILTYGNQLYWHENAGNYGGVGYGTVVNYKWTHIAFSRTVGFLTAYIDGVRVLNSSNSYSYSGTPTRYIGPFNGGTNSPFYISNVHIIKGTGIYSGSTIIVPTAPLTAISGTTLLTCQSNRLIDNSTNNFTITRNGNTAVSPVIPFTANSSYSTYGSAYFNSSSLSVATNAAFNLAADFTIECWVYMTTASGTKTIFTNRTNAGNATGLAWVTQSGSQAMSIYVAAFGLTSSIVIPLNTWTHVALTRLGTTMTQWVNGFSGGTLTQSNVFSDAQCYIGVSNTSSEYWPGYISNFRIVKGTAVYTTAFTPPTVPLTAIANTSLLTLQYNGGATNQAIIDNSNFNNIITRNGNTSQGSFSPYSVNGWSNYFDGTGDYLDVTTGIPVPLTDQFTFEAWVYTTKVNGASSQMIYSQYSTSNANRWTINISTANKLVITHPSLTVTGATTFPINQWNHIAITRDASNTLSIFLNGVVDVTSASYTYSIFQDPPRIGYYKNSPSDYFNGYISNLRVVSGTALYTSEFTPPTSPLTPITNTTLLTCQSNRFIDNSPNSFTLTRNGDVSVQAFGPFGSIPEAVPISYSNYFDGTGDYLTIPTNAAFTFGTGDFTIEGWLYMTTVTSATLFDNRTGTTSLHPVVYYTGSTFSLYVAGAGAITGPSALANQWYHVAISRVSANTKMFINGTQVGSTYADTNNYATSGTVGIGAGLSAGNIVTGYISNLRVIKGTGLYSANFTPSTTPLTAIANTSLLTCQSTIIIDNSTNNFAITAFGDTVPRIFNPFGYTVQSKTNYTPSLHGGSAYFDGTGDYLIVAYNDAFNIPINTAVTFECWVYTSSSAVATLAGRNWSYGAGGPTWGFYLNNGITPVWGIAGTGSSTYILATSTLSGTLGAWNHYVFTRDGSNVVRIFVNGVLGVSRTDGQSMTSASGDVFIGDSTNLAASDFNGYLSNMRFVKGKADYTSNFIPPAQALSNYSTTYPASLLLNFNNGGIIDAHGTHVLETLGNAQLSTAVKKYGVASMYFDGTGDYLTVGTTSSPFFSLSSSRYTIEFWVYFNSLSGEQVLVERFTAPSGPGYTLYKTGSNTINLYGSGSVITNTTVFTTSTWYHIAVTYDGTNTRIFVNGTLEATAAANITDGGSTLIVGSRTGGSAFFNGYIDDFRITKGFARYTANFTAPTSEFLGQ